MAEKIEVIQFFLTLGSGIIIGALAAIAGMRLANSTFLNWWLHKRK